MSDDSQLTLTCGRSLNGCAYAINASRLFCGGRILPGHSAAVAAAMRAQAAAQGVQLHESSPVREVRAGRLQTGDGVWHCFDEALWCTQAAAAGWLGDTGLPVGAC
jgi:NADH dehydrogenase FAD-containing subunit